MNTQNEQITEQLHKLNEQLIANLINQNRQRRSSLKVQAEFKKIQVQIRETLRQKFTTSMNQPNASLDEMLKKLF